MILIADGGSTKADWVALNSDKKEVFRVTTLGLNPAVTEATKLANRIANMFPLINIKDKVTKVYFYGAGCGTPKPIEILKNILESIFINAKVSIAEDMLAAVYASAGLNPALVCILGTGSNSCYFDGKNMRSKTPSLGYTLMDEASGNYFGKILLRDFYYNKIPNHISKRFSEKFVLDVDTVKFNLYIQSNPNMFLATFAKFMLDFKDEKYIKKIIKKGFSRFFKYRVLPYKKSIETPIYFIGSIAFYYRGILEKVAIKHQLKITDVIQKPIDNLVTFHQKKSE